MTIYLPHKQYRAGKITLATVMTAAVVTTTTLFAYFQLGWRFTFATSTVQTSVTVLNTPPQWTEHAHEYVASATSTPTNAGQVLTFAAAATDSSGDPYYLLVCSSNAVAPTAHSSAPPTCGSGIQWAVSTTTYPSGKAAFAATTTTNNFPFRNESNDWYAWVCDAVSNYPQCVATASNSEPNDDGVTPGESYSQSGTHYPDSNSPFVINHIPLFISISNDSPRNPGSNITWTAVASDTDQIRGGDQITLLVCHARDYANGMCTTSGAWATSTAVVAAGANPVNVATSSFLRIPYQDRQYNAFVYIKDQNDLAATTTYTQAGGHQGEDSSFVVNNISPTIQGSLLSFYSSSTADIVLYRPHATSGAYWVDFTVDDNNGCLSASSTSEISLATTTVYRSGVGQYCAENTNNCYPSTGAMTYITCTQSSTVNSCNGSGASLGQASTITDSDVGYRCTVNLWYNADPTDVGSQYPSEDWRAMAQAQDDGQAHAGSGLLSLATTSLNGVELDQFLAYNVSTTSVAYGGLQPGQDTGQFSGFRYTDLIAWGNTGLDERLYGDTMCTTWSAADSCDSGFASTSRIAVWNQQFSTSTSFSFQQTGGVSYPDETTVFGLEPSTTPRYVQLGVNKTTSTSSPFTKNTYWGIEVPGSITFSGDYRGQNTIIGVVSNSTYW